VCGRALRRCLIGDRASFFILSVPLLLSKSPHHARESVGRRSSPSITGATDRPASASSSLFSVRGPRQRAQGRRESLQATPRQRSARASSYGVLPRSDPQGRDTYTAWTPRQPSCLHLGSRTYPT